MLLVILSAVIETGWIAVSRFSDLRLHILETIRLELWVNIFYLIACWAVLQPGRGRISATPGPRARVALVLLAGVAFRLTVWSQPPVFSDDIYRYRWHGKLQAHGGNPYQSRPIDPEWSHLRDETWPRVGSKEFKGAYGPVLELVHRATYAAVSRAFPGDPARQALWFKSPAALADLGLIALLCAWLRSRHLPVERVLIYAWSPLPVVEFWMTGHNDAVMLVALVAALWCADRGLWSRAFTALSLAASAKIWPVVLFPALYWRSGPRWYHPLLLAPVGLAAFLPFWSNPWENARFVTGFLGGWRNNDSLYGLALAITGDVYRSKYLTFALLAAVVVFVARRRWQVDRAALVTIASMLMLSANCHPWYLTWILPFAVFLPEPAILLWTALAPLFYEPLFAWLALGEWNGVSPTRWFVYVPVYGLLAYRFWVSRAARNPRASAAAGPLPQ